MTVEEVTVEEAPAVEEVKGVEFVPLSDIGFTEDISSDSLDAGKAVWEQEEETVNVFATKAAIKLAKKENVDLQQIAGTGKSNRIIESDVKAYLERE